MEDLKKRKFTIEYEEHLKSFALYEKVTRNFKVHICNLSKKKVRELIGLKKKENLSENIK